MRFLREAAFLERTGYTKYWDQMPALDLWTSCLTSWSLSSLVSEMGITVLTIGLL